MRRFRTKNFTFKLVLSPQNIEYTKSTNAPVPKNEPAEAHPKSQHAKAKKKKKLMVSVSNFQKVGWTKAKKLI